jgi:hypothetical protein
MQKWYVCVFGHPAYAPNQKKAIWGFSIMRASPYTLALTRALLPRVRLGGSTPTAMDWSRGMSCTRSWTTVSCRASSAPRCCTWAIQTKSGRSVWPSPRRSASCCMGTSNSRSSLVCRLCCGLRCTCPRCRGAHLDRRYDSHTYRMSVLHGVMGCVN